jgi:hypothetical protein
MIAGPDAPVIGLESITCQYHQFTWNIPKVKA